MSEQGAMIKSTTMGNRQILRLRRGQEGEGGRRRTAIFLSQMLGSHAGERKVFGISRASRGTGPRSTPALSVFASGS